MRTNSMLKVKCRFIILTIRSKQKKVETKNVLINEKNYQDLLT